MRYGAPMRMWIMPRLVRLADLTDVTWRRPCARWKQAGLILLSMLAVWPASQVYMVLSNEVVKSLTDFIEQYIGLDALCLVLYLAAVKCIERRRPAELSLAGVSRELGAGALAGLALFSLVMATLWAAGVYQL